MRTKIIIAALTAAREIVEYDRQATLECCCEFDQETFEPIIETIDESGRAGMAAYDAVLAKINAALAELGVRT
ncbi:hypothetical protein C8N35_102114 [Breoghania corrubedonensis]|uniref:Uncharacterized protein n=1 Tax=Breoghania corrubedonensis TaxID=665038 RepID=A0A2T5VCE8_9HYPH|nr:hypothetical protein [Breoghania corrubedonensis]PTW61405.1 hypothetical protein C8N35_102114 [Breoghania corrubedonensis]